MEYHKIMFLKQMILKTKGCHGDNFVVTGGTAGCREKRCVCGEITITSFDTKNWVISKFSRSELTQF